jgi:hypothetical protein
MGLSLKKENRKFGLYVPDRLVNGKGNIGRNTGGEARSLISQLLDSGYSLRDIGKMVDRDHTHIWRVIKGKIKNPPEDFIETLQSLVKEKLDVQPAEYTSINS